MTFLKNSASQFATAFAKRGLVAGMLLLIARRGGAVLLGQYTLVFGLSYIFNNLAGFGTTPISIREIAKNRSRAAHIIATALGVRMACALLAMIIVVAASPFVAPDPVTRRAMCLFTLAIIPLNLIDLSQAVFSAFERMHYCAVLSLIHWGLTFVGSWIVLARSGSNVVPLLAVQIVAFWCAAFLGLFWTHRRFIPLRVEWRGWMELLRQSYPLAAGAVLASVYFRIGTFLLANIRSTAAAGFFAPALHLTEAAQVIPAALTAACFPSLSRRVTHNPGGSAEFLGHALKYLCILGAMTVLLTISLAEEGVTVALGASFRPVIPLVRIGCIAIIPMFMNFGLQTYFMAADRQGIILKNSGRLAVFGSITYYVAIRYFGLSGAVAAMPINEFFLLLMNCVECRGLVSIRRVGRGIRSTVAALGVAVAVGLASSAAYGARAQGALGVLAFAMLLWLSKAVRRSDLLALMERGE